MRERIGARFVVGGDFNSARSLATAYPARFGHGEFWREVDESEMCEALPYGLGERQSYWGHWERNEPPTLSNSLQDDHLLFDAQTRSLVEECRVWDTKR